MDPYLLKQEAQSPDPSTTKKPAEPVGEDAQTPPPETDTLPLLAVPGRVIFPGMVLPIPAITSRGIRMVEDALPNERRLALVAGKDPDDADPEEEDIFTVGVEARLLRMVKQGNDATILIIQARQRVRITEITQTEPFFRARVETIEDKTPQSSDKPWTAAVRNLRESAIKLIELNPNLPDEARVALENIEDPALLTDVIAGNLGIDIEEKQKLLEQPDVVLRLESLQRILNHQVEIAELQQKLRDDVQSEFSDSQRRAYLREQMRAIQRELGEGDGTGEQVEELRARLDEAKLPEEVQTEADRELKRLEAIPNASPEYSVIVTYLETLAELPWSKSSEDKLDLDDAQATLDRDHFGLEKIKRRLIEYLAVRKLNPDGLGPILCLVGPPGVGKTSLGQSVADALGRKFARIALGGIRDEAEIRGHRRTYIGSMPGRLIQELRRAGTNNPVIMLDEIDKIGADFRGDPASALLEVLDPRQNNAFVDRYLDVSFDLPKVIFIATANIIDPVPAPLRDRMEIIQISGYTDSEKLEIARRYIVPRQLQENGLTDHQCEWDTAALRLVISEYTREAGVRNLEREIGSVCRWVAAKVAREETDHWKVTGDSVREALGPEKVTHEEAVRESAPGIVNGLAYTPAGGEVLHIEAVRFPGKGEAKLTGQLGDVMKESVSIAASLVRTRAADLGIDPTEFDRTDVHIHVPAGAIPKDGPSAGIAMFVAMASLFSAKKVRSDVAMTGELTLRGLVLPIGGLKEKLLAAHRAGIKRALIPNQNKRDLAEIPQEVRDALIIIPVENVDQVLDSALES
ncbi:endopeptidase La [soil metagenome]